MPIIIDEFEIRVDVPSERPEQQPAGPPAAPAPPLRPEDIVLVERRHRERMGRVRAD